MVRPSLSGPMLLGLAYLLILVLPLVLGWLIWSRYLYHKETMKLADMGLDREAHWPSLEIRERWRLRWGMLAGAAIAAAGLAGGIGLLVYMGIARPRPGFLSTTAGGLEPEVLTVLLLLCVFLMIVGAVTLVAHSSWGRQVSPARPPVEPEGMTERWRLRRGITWGATLVLLGGAILALTPAAPEIIPVSLYPERYFGVVGGFVIGVGALMVALHVVWSLTGERIQDAGREAVRSEEAVGPDEAREGE
jgi:hypothetical protein